jgi:hypothetical protein
LGLCSFLFQKIRIHGSPIPAAARPLTQAVLTRSIAALSYADGQSQIANRKSQRRPPAHETVSKLLGDDLETKRTAVFEVF